ncbi:MAG TPA: alpha/beta fold hydrolase [Candidatus Rifleibacterium sp.]|nr:alpha/beta fold hydrolase [Candidatus Rifleibacterium sp.]HPT45769.1 alpha/beta fold hydrolase [Candidatus Rifleibacterium sp.]
MAKAKEQKQKPEEYQELVSRSVMKRYTEADRRRLGMTPTRKTAVFHQGPWTLYRYGDDFKSDYAPVVIVPSLINRNYVLDLLPGHSLIEQLKASGLDVFMIDWGDPDAGMGEIGFDHYISVWVRRAIRQVKRITGHKKVQLAGQCIGGMMAALYASHADLRQDISSLFLLTAPIDLAESGLLSNWTSAEGFDIEKLTAAYQGIVPAQFFHASFPLLDTRNQLSKYRRLQENFEIEGFKNVWEALDIWGSDNVDFAKKAFKELIKTFYQENAFCKGHFSIMGVPVNYKDIDIPTLCLVARDDHVFSEKAARVILDCKAAKKGKLDYHVIPAGHVSLIAAHPVRVTTYALIKEFLTR